MSDTFSSAQLGSAAYFIQNIGVNWNMDEGNTSQSISQMQYLGVSLVRQQLNSSPPSAFAPAVQAGIRFDMLSEHGGSQYGGVLNMSTIQSELDQFAKAFPGAIVSVEGPNEPNLETFTYGGQTDPIASADAFQQDLYNMVHSDPNLAGVPVLDYALGGAGPDAYAQAGDQSGMSDYANIHSYPDPDTPMSIISNQSDLTSPYTPNEPGAQTEYGSSVSQGITPVHQALTIVDGLLDSAALGIGPTFIYELQDGNTGDGQYEDNFGLFDSSGNPKLSGTAVHNLTTLLADSGSGPLPAPVFQPTVQGLSSSANELLLQKYNGVAAVALWQESGTTGETVKVNFGHTASEADLFDPLKGTTPIAGVAHASSMSFQLNGDPLILLINP